MDQPVEKQELEQKTSYKPLTPDRARARNAGNSLFQELVVIPLQAASAFIKASGPRVLTPEQRKRKDKNRAKRKMRRASR